MNTNELRAERIRHGFDVRRMSELIGVTEVSYRNKEIGKHLFKTPEIKIIMDLLELSPDQVVNIFIK